MILSDRLFEQLRQSLPDYFQDLLAPVREEEGVSNSLARPSDLARNGATREAGWCCISTPSLDSLPSSSVA